MESAAEAKGQQKTTQIPEEYLNSCFAVEPKRDCPHITDTTYQTLINFLRGAILKLKANPGIKNIFSTYSCPECLEEGSETKDKANEENWLCLTCGEVHCSRYVAGHAAQHNEETGHPIAFSFSDGSFWCYEDNCYITNKRLDRLRKIFGHIKHRKNVQGGRLGDDDELDELIDLYKSVSLNEDVVDGFTFEELSSGLGAGKFKKICFVTGAGISVAAGIPDFRSKGGLYEELGKEYGVSKPEEMMTLDFFLKSPEVFYKIMREFLKADVRKMRFIELDHLISVRLNNL